MANLLFVIISAGTLGVAAIFGTIGRIMYRKRGYASTPASVILCISAFMALMCLIMGVIGTATSIKRIPEDHVRILSRGGEVFRVLDDGYHYMWEIIPYDEYNLSRRWRTSSFTPAEGETVDGIQWPIIIEEDGRDRGVNVTVDWRIKSDGEYIESAWQSIRRHSRENNNPGAKLEDRMWHKEVAPSVRDAVAQCSEEEGYVFYKAKTTSDFNEIERCIEGRFDGIITFREDRRDTSLYEIRNVRNVRVFLV